MRSKRLKRLIIVLTIIVVFLALYLNWQRLSNFAIKRSLGLLEKNIQAKLAYSSMAGGIFQNPNFSGIKLIFLNGDSILAKRLSINYDIMALLRGRFIFRQIELTEPEIIWHIKKTTSTKKEAKPTEIKLTKLPNLTLPRLEITDGKIYINSELRAQNIKTVLSINSNKGKAKANLQKLTLELTKEKIRLAEARGMFSYENDELSVDTLWLKTDKSQAAIKGDFNFSTSSFDVQLQKISLDLNEILKQPGKLLIQGKIKGDQNGLNGKISLTVTNAELQKIPIPDCQAEVSIKQGLARYNLATIEPMAETISAIGEVNLVDMTYQGKVNFQNILLANFLPTKIPHFQINGVLEFSSKTNGQIDLQIKSNLPELSVDSLIVDGLIAKNNIIVKDLKLGKAGKQLTLTGSLAKAKIDLDYNLSNFPLTLLDELFQIKSTGSISGNGRIGGRPDSLAALTDLNLIDSRIEMINFSKLHTSFEIHNLLALLNKKISYRNRIKNLNLAIDSLTIGKREYGNLALQVEDSSFTLSLKNSDFSVFSRGKIKLSKNDIFSQIDTIALRIAGEFFSLRQPFRLARANNRVYLTGLQGNFNGSDFDLDLNFSEITQPDIQLKVQNLDLSKVGKFFKYKGELNGLANLNIKTNENYELDFAVNDFKYPYSGIDFKSMEGRVTVSKNKIELKKIRLIRVQDPSEITGYINYTRGANQRRLEFQDIDLKASISDPGVWVFSFLRNIIGVKSGQVFGTIEAKGEWQNPYLSGRVRLNNAKLFIVATNTDVDKANGELLFDRNRIILSKISGQVGKGSINATGWTDLQNLRTVKALQYDINGQDLPIHPQKDIYGVVSGKLQIAWQENRPTALNGDIIVKEALLTIGFGGAVKSGSASNLVYNITVKGERGIWLRNSYCDIELSIDLNLRKTLTETFYSGTLNTRQGNLYYLDHNLTLTEGSITLDNINELNPDLNLNAEMYTRPMQINSGSTERVKIKLQLTGTLAKPVFTFSSEPSVLTQEDIISYLTLNVTPQEINAAQQREVFNKLVSERFLGYFERTIANKLRNYIKLDYLQFESGLLEAGKTAKVTVGKYISQNLYATYTHNVSGEVQDLFKVEYYITKSHELVGERDDQGRYRVKYQFKFRY